MNENTTKPAPFRYHVRVAPGCHGGPGRFGGIVSRHRTLERAIAAARRNDRTVVVDDETGDTVYQLGRQDHPTLGAGRFGRGSQ